MRENEIVKLVYEAKENLDAADQLIRDYLPFIKSETVRFLKRPLNEGEDDELCIAMFAFHEAVLAYHQRKGAFLKFAALGIRHRLIDYYRKEKRHKDVISLNQSGREDEEIELIDTLDSGVNETEELHNRSSAKAEIEDYAAQLKEYGLSLEDIAENCPKQSRTLQACHQALAYAKENTHILDSLVATKKIPLSQLASGSEVSQKTLERHRKYMVAILLAYTNGFEIIRGHLYQIAPRKEEKNVCAI